MNNPIKRAIITGALATCLAIGGAGVAVATTGAAASPTRSADGEQSLSYVGTIPAPSDASTGAEGAEGTEGSDTAAEASESAALSNLAKISATQATSAALRSVPGTASATQLENDNGYVVYSVLITRADGSTVDVKVDAGNGTVLAQDNGDGDGETAD